MSKQLFVVPELAVKVVTGDTCYSREGGFSAITAEVALEDPALIKEVAFAQKSRHLGLIQSGKADGGL